MKLAALHVIFASIVLPVEAANAPRTAGPQGSRSGDPGFGYEWIEANGFPVMALVDYFNDQVPVLAYEQANFSESLVNHEPDGYWSQYVPALMACELRSLGYHLVPPTPNNSDIVQRMSELAEDLGGFSVNRGFYAVDEPTRIRMDDVRDLIFEVRSHFVDSTNEWSAKPIWATAMEENECGHLLWGGCPPGDHCSYPYDQYLADMIDVMTIDVLAYDNYPFKLGDETGNFYRNMMRVRDVAVSRGVPYWVWLQASDLPDSEGKARGRMPSESDIRVQAFAHLAVGYSGFSYFKYHLGYIWEVLSGPPGISPGMLPNPGHVNGNGPGVGYETVSALNLELRNLGSILKHLRHVDAKVVIGPGAVWDAHEHIPELHVSDPLYAGNGFIDADVREDDNDSPRENLLVSVFREEEKPETNMNYYFMLTVLDHAAERTASDMELHFTVDFDGRIDLPDGSTRQITELLYVNNRTGETEHEYLTSLGGNAYRLELTLESGSRLFKFDNGDFPR